MPRKGRARRFREARELKQGYDDGLFSEGSRTLADLEEGTSDATNEWDDGEEKEHDAAWDEEDPLLIDERRDPDQGGRRAAS